MQASNRIQQEIAKSVGEIHKNVNRSTIFAGGVERSLDMPFIHGVGIATMIIAECDTQEERLGYLASVLEAAKSRIEQEPERE